METRTQGKGYHKRHLNWFTAINSSWYCQACNKLILKGEKYILTKQRRMRKKYCQNCGNKMWDNAK